MKYFCFGVVGMVRRKFMGAAVFDSACRAFSTGIIIIKIAVSPHRSPEPFSGRTFLFTDKGREHEYLCQFVSSQAPRCGMTLTAICAPLSFKWRSRAALRGLSYLSIFSFYRDMMAVSLICAVYRTLLEYHSSTFSSCTCLTSPHRFAEPPALRGA